MSPEVCFSRPAIIRSRVVFPQPLGPSKTRNSPSLVARSTPSTAVVSANRFWMLRVSTIAIALPLRPRGLKKRGRRRSTPPSRNGTRPGRLDQLLLLPLGPNALALRLRLLDGVLGGHRLGARLGKHGVDHPGAENFVNGRSCVAGVTDVGGPVERIREHLVLVGRLALG